MVHPAMMSRLRETALEVGLGAVHRFRRFKYRSHLPHLETKDQLIVTALERDGGYATNVDALGVPGSDEMLGEADRLVEEMRLIPRRDTGKDYVIAAAPELITRFPAILRWGLEERLLAIAETYIGMLVTYRGVLARFDFPDGTVRETRLWHLDQEDSRILKIIVYLDDVDADGGPFEYIPASVKQPRQLAEGPKKRINDADDLAQLVPPDLWRAVTGKRGTVAFVDTCRIFHRGRLPTGKTRKSLFFCYNSRWPFRPSHCEPLFDVDQFLEAEGSLGPRQNAALDFSYLCRT